MTLPWLDAATWVLLVAGGAFGVIGGIGIVRLPDFYARLHAAGITDTLAAYLIIGGLMLQGGLTLVSVKLALIAFFLFFTSPVATHALANAAFHNGLQPWTLDRNRKPAPDDAPPGPASSPEGDPPSDS